MLSGSIELVYTELLGAPSFPFTQESRNYEFSVLHLQGSPASRFGRENCGHAINITSASLFQNLLYKTSFASLAALFPSSSLLHETQLVLVTILGHGGEDHGREGLPSDLQTVELSHGF